MAAGESNLPEAVSGIFPFASHYFQAGAGAPRCHYLDEGQGTPVVMVHGNPTWSFFYRNLVLALSGSHRCIVPDHLGCGLSDKPQDPSLYHLAGHRDRLDALLAHLDLPEFDLVVHDWGGPIGIGAALRHVDKLRRIVILNTAAFRSRRIPLRINICRTPGVGEWVIRGLNGFAGPATFMATARGLPPDVKAGYLFPYSNWADRIAVDRFVKDIPLKEGHPSYPALLQIETGLEKLKGKPMLIQWGGRDFCFHDAFYKEWRERFPEADHDYYADAGHYVLEDAGDAVNERIARFLKR